MADDLFKDAPEPRPFLEDGSQYGISQAAFEAMEEAEQRNLMRDWFYQNFEDPNGGNAIWDGETKEYVFLWGGPFDAHAQLWDKFGDFISEDIIIDIAKSVERDHGIDEWAPSSTSPFYEHDEPPDPRDEEPPPLEIYLDEPSDRYGSREEREVRAKAIEAIDNLRKVLATRRPIGIGHNRPPEDDEPDEIKELEPALIELQGELEKPSPDIASVKRWALPLRNALMATLKWSWKKVDGATSAVFNAGAVGGTVWLVDHPEYVKTAYEVVVQWLDVAAKTLF